MENEHTLICYRTACNAPADVRGYNRVTHGLYCMNCARTIEKTNMAGISLYPLLDAQVSEGGRWGSSIVRVRT